MCWIAEWRIFNINHSIWRIWLESNHFMNFIMICAISNFMVQVSFEHFLHLPCGRQHETTRDSGLNAGIVCNRFSQAQAAQSLQQPGRTPTAWRAEQQLCLQVADHKRSWVTRLELAPPPAERRTQEDAPQVQERCDGIGHDVSLVHLKETLKCLNDLLKTWSFTIFTSNWFPMTSSGNSAARSL